MVPNKHLSRHRKARPYSDMSEYSIPRSFVRCYPITAADGSSLYTALRLLVSYLIALYRIYCVRYRDASFPVQYRVYCTSLTVPSSLSVPPSVATRRPSRGNLTLAVCIVTRGKAIQTAHDEVLQRTGAIQSRALTEKTERRKRKEKKKPRLAGP